MNFDYNYFTKAELVSFLNKHGDDFKYTTKPYQIILEKKIKDIENNIERALQENTFLIEQLKNTEPCIGEAMKIGVQLNENHETYRRLERKRKELCKLMWEEH